MDRIDGIDGIDGILRIWWKGLVEGIGGRSGKIREVANVGYLVWKLGGVFWRGLIRKTGWLAERHGVRWGDGFDRFCRSGYRLSCHDGRT